jgi:DNA modification methylase
MTKKPTELKTNVIICGDCEHRMKEHIPKESVDLIYLDPPFFSGRDYDLIWGKGDGKSKATIKVFEDAALYVKKCGECGRIWRKNPRGEFYKTCGTANCVGKLDGTKDVRMSDVGVFVEWLRPRIQECYRVLKSYLGIIILEMKLYGVILDQVTPERNNSQENTTRSYYIRKEQNGRLT